MAKTPTVYDVAQRAGVSIATVSFAFRRPDKVRASTRDAVMAAAQELGYVPNVNARGLAHGRTGALGLYSFDYLLDDDTTETTGPSGDDVRLFPLYVDEVQRGVELECWRRGYALMVGGSGSATSGAVVTDIAGRVDGLAVFPRTVPDDVLQNIARRIPVVEVSEPRRDGTLSHVTVDNVGGMRQVVEHLVSVHEMRDLAFVGAVDALEAKARWRGFRTTLRRAGLSTPAETLTAPGGAAEQANAVATRLLSQPSLPDALVCITDLDAIALIGALTSRGLRVPQDVAVTGFDGIVAGRLSAPTLTTVRQPMQQLGRTVVELLDALVTGEATGPENRQLPVELVVRESCGCPSSAR